MRRRRFKQVGTGRHCQCWSQFRHQYWALRPTMPVAVHSNPDGVSCPSGPSSTPVAMHLAMRNGEGAPVSPANLPGNPTLADARRRAVDFRAAGSIFLEDQGRSSVIGVDWDWRNCCAAVNSASRHCCRPYAITRAGLHHRLAELLKRVAGSRHMVASIDWRV